MKLCIIGCNGMLGTDMMIRAKKEGHEVTGADLPGIDITQPDSVRECIDRLRPGLIINCAAYTAVDACETNAETAFAVNGTGAGNLARAAEELGIPLVYISTDYVFDGKKNSPYLETDRTNPATVYGRSKLEGELLVRKNCSRCYIVRIAWLYGLYGNNFVRAIRAAAKKNAQAGEPLLVVNDQSGTPTWTVSVCRQVLRLVSIPRYGIFHCTSEGACTWYDFAQEIIAAAGLRVPVQPCTTDQFPRPARRPACSVLENQALKSLGINSMPQWKQAFRKFLEAEKGIPD
ncbi:MAG: dTDP-4-dehydrorhamnose reductase [Chitinispirillaceae bacterium]|nr:dTDP-4-dehydrorhamnose reductase [Chitinispirillaceae bacterium]